MSLRGHARLDVDPRDEAGRHHRGLYWADETMQMQGASLEKHAQKWYSLSVGLG